LVSFDLAEFGLPLLVRKEINLPEVNVIDMERVNFWFTQGLGWEFRSGWYRACGGLDFYAP